MSSDSYLSAKCVSRPSPVGGNGVFAAEAIEPGELIAVWGGRIYRAGQLQALASAHPNLIQHPLAVAEGLYLGPADPTKPPEPADFFNHSCEPNAGVRGQVMLVARRGIRPGEEVCFDYETTEGEGGLGMGFICRCGSGACRGSIDGRMWRDSDFQHANRGFLAPYLVERIVHLPQTSDTHARPCC